MSAATLFLPVGGTASRIMGLPKFLLPVSDTESLIQKHIVGAQDAGISEVVILCREVYINILQEHLRQFKNVEVVCLPRQTSTMNETLQTGLSIYDPNSEIIVSLADTFYFNCSYTEVYSKLLSAPALTLGLFKIRNDQIGKLGQVLIADNGEVIDMSDKQPNCDYIYAWGNLKVPKEFIQRLDVELPHIGYSLEKALRNGMEISSAIFEGEYFDCGTFAEYKKLLSRFT